MSLKSFFPEQFDELRAFLVSEAELVRCLAIDPGMQALLMRALVKMEQSDNFPHVFVRIDTPFSAAESYFERLSLAVDQTIEHNASQLAEWGCRPAPAVSGPNSDVKFVTRATAFVECLPEFVGSLVFVLAPERIYQPEAFRSLIRKLAVSVRTRWLKFLVLDAQPAPVLQGINLENPDIGEQSFHFPPAEMERRIQEDLRNAVDLTPAERRQYHGLLAGFAFANQDYAKAEQLQRAWVNDAKKSGEPFELANAYFSLGNTLLSKGEHAGAVAVFCLACDLCIDKKLHAIAPYIYTSLGLALNRQGNNEQSFAALKVARDMFKAQNQKPGEAYVVDCLAQIYATEGSTHEAAKAWRHVLSIYKSITAPHFQNVVAAGCKDVRTKLAKLGVDDDAPFVRPSGQSSARNPRL